MRFRSSDDSPIFMIRLVADRGGIMKGGLAQVGRVGVTCAMRSCDQLASRQLVGPALEDELDRRELGDRLRAQLVEAGHPAELLLDRNGDQLLDLVRGVAERDRLDLDPRRRELGEHVDLRAGNLGDAEDHHRRGARTARASGTAGSGTTIQRITASSAPRSLARDLELRAVHLGGSHRHDPRAGGGPPESSTRSSAIRVDRDPSRRYCSGLGLV